MNQLECSHPEVATQQPRNLLHRLLLSIEDGDRYLFKPAARWIALRLGWGCPSRYQVPWFHSNSYGPRTVRCSRVKWHLHGQHLCQYSGAGWDSGNAEQEGR